MASSVEYGLNSLLPVSSKTLEGNLDLQILSTV